jgi:cysteine desulfurase
VDLVYLDNAASTRPAPEVRAAMAEAEAQHYANPASAHRLGAAAARALGAAREEVARALGAEPGELVFTSGGTEANALGLLGAARRARGRHLIVTAIEHSSVLRTARRLVAESATPGGTGVEARQPYGKLELDVVPVGPTGVGDPGALAAALRPDTAVVAVMLVNNELGTVQPVAEVARALARAAAGPTGRRPHLHVDAVQAFCLHPFRPAALGADTVAVSAHKIHGPKGAGALWIRPGARIDPLWDGGEQERGLRSGTENLPAIVGFGRAAALGARAAAEGATARVASLRDDLEARIVAAVAAMVPGVRPTVAGAAGIARAAHISSLAFPGLPAEPLLHALEARGIIAAAGSACASKRRGPSHVLQAIGLDDDTAALRFSLSRDTTAAEVAAAIAALPAAVAEVMAVAQAGGRGGGVVAPGRGPG